MRHAPFSTTGPLDSDAMDTANAHNDTIDETADLLEQESATDDETSELLEREPPTDDKAPTQPAEASSTPPVNGWVQRLSTPAAGWVATAIATLVAALIRLPGLGNVRTLIFDETYYVKDAWSLLALGYEGTWAKDVDTAFANGDTSGLSAVGGYPVHPPTGKWIIAMGMKFFGQSDPVGWRIAAAICGVITVFLLCRLAQNLFRSPAITLLAGLFLATDGMAIVMSRTSILDGFLAMFALAAFLCVVKDQQMAQPALSAKLAEWDGLSEPRQGWRAAWAHLTLRDRRPFAIGPNAGNRPWLLAAGICAGLACSVKWSGIYVLAFLGLFVALREVTCRWRAGPPGTDPRSSPRRRVVGVRPRGSDRDSHIRGFLVRLVHTLRRSRAWPFRHCGIRRTAGRPVALPQGDVDIPQRTEHAPQVPVHSIHVARTGARNLLLLEQRRGRDGLPIGQVRERRRRPRQSPPLVGGHRRPVTRPCRHVLLPQLACGHHCPRLHRPVRSMARSMHIARSLFSTRSRSHLSSPWQSHG